MFFHQNSCRKSQKGVNLPCQKSQKGVEVEYDRAEIYYPRF